MSLPVVVNCCSVVSYVLVVPLTHLAKRHRPAIVTTNNQLKLLIGQISGFGLLGSGRDSSPSNEESNAHKRRAK